MLLPIFALFGQASPPAVDPQQFDAFAQLVFDAFKAKNAYALGSLLVVVMVWAARKWGAAKFPQLATARGGAALALAFSLATAAATAALSGGPLGLGTLMSAMGIMLFSVAGRALLKKVILGDSAADAQDAAKAAGAKAADTAQAAGELKSPADLVNK